jgi:hypothetical protein
MYWGTTWAYDSYNPITHKLSIPTLQVGAATYSNVIVTIGKAALTSNRSFAVGNFDTYSPLYQQLVVPTVFVSGQPAPYYNVIATVFPRVSRQPGWRESTGQSRARQRWQLLRDGPLRRREQRRCGVQAHRRARRAPAVTESLKAIITAY